MLANVPVRFLGERIFALGFCEPSGRLAYSTAAFPSSTFVGSDYHAGSIETARRRAEAAGVSDRVRFETAPAAAYTGEGYDLVLRNPDGTLRVFYGVTADVSIAQLFIAGVIPGKHTTRKGWLTKDFQYPRSPYTTDIDARVWEARDGSRMSVTPGCFFAPPGAAHTAAAG